MPVIDSATTNKHAKSFDRNSSGTLSASTSMVASKEHLKILSDIIARIIIPRKIHVINDGFHVEILVKSQKIVGFRHAGVEEWANIKVEPEFIYVEDPTALSVQVEVRKVIDAAACSLDEGKILIQRLQSHEKSQLSLYGPGILPADALSAEFAHKENGGLEAHSLAIEVKSEAESDESDLVANVSEDNISEVNISEDIIIDPPKTDRDPSAGDRKVKEFFEKIKEKSTFAYLQSSIEDEPCCYGGCDLENNLPEDMLAKLNEWNHLVSGSLSEGPKFVTSLGTSTNDSAMVLAVSDCQRLLVELNVNKLGVAIALWNSTAKKV